MNQFEILKMWGCGDLRMWGFEVVGIRQFENLKMREFENEGFDKSFANLQTKAKQLIAINQ